MSEEQSIDPQLVEQTKQQIRSLVAEVAQLSKSDVSPEQFYSEFLPRVVSALAAAGGAVWTLNAESRLTLQFQINIQEARIRDSEASEAQHARLLYQTLAGGQGLLMPPHSGAGQSDGPDQETPAANPTDFLLVLGLLKTDLETVGVVEIFQRPEAGPTAQKGYLRFLSQMCDLAGDFLKSHQLRHFSHRQTLWTQLEDFTRAVHASLDLRETAYTIANEGRRLIECDRLSVALSKGNRCQVEAISGQDMFDKRSNIVRLLDRLTSAVVRSGDPVWYTGDTRDMPPQVEESVQEYVDESHSKTVAVLPLRRPSPAEKEESDKSREPDHPIGALVIEQIEDSRVSGNLVQRAEVVSRHSAAALANAVEHQNLFLMPLWRAIGKSRWVVEARTLPKTLSIGGAVLLVVLLIGVWPAQFTVESKGTLEPAARQDIFAGVDGVVQELDCQHGQMVRKDQVLVKLRNTELAATLADLQGQRMAAGERLLSVQRALVGEKKLSPDQRNQLEGEQAELWQKQQSLNVQWGLYRTKEADLAVRSPLDGVVVTWDLKNRLMYRTVQRGQVLLRVADPNGPWQLELTMPEHRMGHLMLAQQKLYRRLRERFCELVREQTRAKLGDAATDEEVEKAVEAASTDTPDEKLGRRIRELAPDQPCEDRLKVSYILATEPGTPRYGTVEEIHRSAEVRGEDGNTVLIKVAIDKTELPDLRPGATVTAKVDCGRSLFGYVLLHDVLAFIQSRILFRYF
ncbi:MAG: biotin/lipoyl-binding protein [Planctomycetaceae bacterium]|nr:biotin/lipoyl-binding protein [Planctomycetaceae bacterium]